MANINPQKMLPSAKGGPLAKTSGSSVVPKSKLIASTKKINIAKLSGNQQKQYSGSLEDDVQKIKISVLNIEKMLKGGFVLQQKDEQKKRKAEESEKFETKEKNLEKKPSQKEMKKAAISVPQLGIFGVIKRFIVNTVLGFLAYRLIEYLPQAVKFASSIMKVADFLIDVGGKLLNGLVTFVDWSYKAIDFTRGALKTFGGENAGKVFDKFTGAVGTLVETAVIVATTLATQGDGGVLDIGMDMLRDRLIGQGVKQAGQQVAGQVAGNAARVGGMGVGVASAIVAGAGLAASALGEGAFQVKKISQKFEKNIKEYSEAGKKDKNPITRTLKMGVWSMFGPFLRLGNWLLNGIGVTLDIVGAPFRYAIELIRYGIMLVSGDTKGIEQQRKNLAKFDARIRDGIREHFAGFLGPIFGFMGKKDWKKGIETKGSFGSLFGQEGTKGMGYASGGSTSRGGKSFRKVARRKKAIRRTITKTPRRSEVKPGRDIGGEQKIFGVFPNPFAGLFGKSKEKPEDKGPDTFGFLKRSSEKYSKIEFFGPMMTLASNVLLGQKPNQMDYENVALGINALIAKGMKSGKLRGGVIAGFAEGGPVSPDISSGDADITKWVEGAVKDSVSKEVDDVTRDLMKNILLKKKQEADTPTDPSVQESGESEPGALGTSGAPGAPGSAHPGWARIYELARKAGDPFPEVTASQWAIESGYGKYKTGKNNPFGQTGTHPKYGGTTLATPRDPGGGSKTFMNFGSEAEAVAFRVKRWVPEYGNAKTPYEALMNIQKHGGRGRYAQGWPTRAFPEGDWMGYVRSVSTIIKNNGGDPNRPKTSGTAPALADEPSRGKLPSGVKGGSLRTGPSSYIGGSTAYHIDTKFHKSLGMGNMVSAMDKLANAYSSRGRKIEFSNGGVSGEVWNPKASSEEKKSLLQRAFDAHSHSRFMRAEGFLPFDYYNPKKNDTRFGKSVEGSEILLPTFGGKVDVGAKYGGYGKSAEIFSGNKMVAMTGHGDVRYEKGGPTLATPHTALIGEKGREYVIDADSFASTEKVAPGLLDILNYDVNNKESLKKNMGSILGTLNQFAPYELGASQTVVVDSSSDSDMDMNMGGQSGGLNISGGSDQDQYDPFSKLYAIG